MIEQLNLGDVNIEYIFEKLVYQFGNHSVILDFDDAKIEHLIRGVQEVLNNKYDKCSFSGMSVRYNYATYTYELIISEDYFKLELVLTKEQLNKVYVFLKEILNRKLM
ncbi:MAG: hypothetical protein LC122_14165 [Chitinophagales bacterium]|nr:hypothetical protein [Chitinophagales bacterium]